MSSPLSGFTAVPNPQMLAFMGAQSFIMMYQAGEGWQYGKRKISAMSNEEFNKLTPELVLEKQAVVLRNSLQTIEKSMNAMTPMIGTIVKQYGDFIREIIASIPQAISNISHDPNHPTDSLPPAGVAGFLTPAISLIPKEVQRVTNPIHEHPDQIPVFGPQKPSAQEIKAIAANEKFRQEEADRITRANARRIADLKAKSDLQNRQDALENHKKQIDTAVKNLGAASGRSLNSFPGSSWNDQIARANKLSAKTAYVKPFIVALSNLRTDFHKKYGYWY